MFFFSLSKYIYMCVCVCMYIYIYWWYFISEIFQPISPSSGEQPWTTAAPARSKGRSNVLRSLSGKAVPAPSAAQTTAPSSASRSPSRERSLILAEPTCGTGEQRGTYGNGNKKWWEKMWIEPLNITDRWENDWTWGFERFVHQRDWWNWNHVATTLKSWKIRGICGFRSFKILIFCWCASIIDVFLMNMFQDSVMMFLMKPQELPSKAVKCYPREWSFWGSRWREISDTELQHTRRTNIGVKNWQLCAGRNMMKMAYMIIHVFHVQNRGTLVTVQ